MGLYQRLYRGSASFERLYQVRPIEAEFQFVERDHGHRYGSKGSSYFGEFHIVGDVQLLITLQEAHLERKCLTNMRNEGPLHLSVKENKTTTASRICVNDHRRLKQVP